MINPARERFLNTWRMVSGITLEIAATLVMMAAAFVVGFFIFWWFDK